MTVLIGSTRRRSIFVKLLFVDLGVLNKYLIYLFQIAVGIGFDILIYIIGERRTAVKHEHHTVWGNDASVVAIDFHAVEQSLAHVVVANLRVEHTYFLVAGVAFVVEAGEVVLNELRADSVVNFIGCDRVIRTQGLGLVQKVKIIFCRMLLVLAVERRPKSKSLRRIKQLAVIHYLVAVFCRFGFHAHARCSRNHLLLSLY